MDNIYGRLFNAKDDRAKLILESDHGLTLVVTIRFNFPNSNYQSERQYCLVELCITLEMEDEMVIKFDS